MPAVPRATRRAQLHRYVHSDRGSRIDIDQLALSPQCGFASGISGNDLKPDEQWQTLDVIQDTAPASLGLGVPLTLAAIPGTRGDRKCDRRRCDELSDSTTDDDAVSLPPSVIVEDPRSPMIGAELTDPLGRQRSTVEIWNAATDPEASGLRVAGSTVVPFEVRDETGDAVGFFSTCFPARSCQTALTRTESGCIGLQDGNDDCIVGSSSGQRHLVRVMQGPVSVAEVLAAVDLAEHEAQ